MKRIVVSLSKLDIETETTFRDLMGENGIAFWHRLPGIWLLSTPDEFTFIQIRDMVGDRLQGVTMVVVEAEHAAVRVPLNQREWFVKHWGVANLTPVDKKD
jgi:hypothetical protein